MGINIIPKERDEKSDISRLEIKYNRGSVESPNRFITKVDINAKDNIGADIPLTRTRKLFLGEEFINPSTINLILNNNGYLGIMLAKYQKFLLRLRNSDPLRLIFPKFTKNGKEEFQSLNNSSQNRVIHFIFQLIQELSNGNSMLDGFCIQYDILSKEARQYLENQDLPFIPVVDMHEESKIINKQIDDYLQMSSSTVPFIGLTYSTLTRTNLAFNKVISVIDKLHEQGKGFITVDSPRVSGVYSEDPDVSALHYSNFVSSDLSAEKSYVGGKSSNLKIKLFEKTDLVVSELGVLHDPKEHKDEINFLNEDKKLKELLINMISGEGHLKEQDKERAKNLSRVHENVFTNSEYEEMRKSLINNELSFYRSKKRRLNQLLLNEGR
jgi:hypothetical protein